MDDDDFIKNIKPLDQQALARFNLYAPHVRYLTDYITDWLGGAITWIVILKAVPTRPLLPNLRDCSIYDRDQFLGSPQIIRSLLCPSLVKIRASGRREGKTRPVLSPQLMAKISELSPSLQILEFHSRHSRQPVSDAFKPPALSNNKSSIPIIQLRSLRTLEAGPEILSFELLTMLGAQIPSLESLSICIPNDTPEHMMPKQLPQFSHGFSALKHFGIYCEGPEILLDLWKSLSFIRHVISVYIKLEPDLEADGDILCDLISSVCLQSPDLTDLHFQFKSDYRLVDLDLLTPEVISNIGCLPLQRLRILTPELDVRLLPPDNFESLALALSNVKYLELPGLMVSFEGVAAMAQHMPRLQFLAVALTALDWPKKSQLPLTPPTSDNVLLIRSHFTFGAWYERKREREIYYKSLPVALSRLWPNGAHCEFSELAAGGVQQTEKEGLDLINQTIKQLLSPRDFTVPDSLDLVSRWRYSKVDDSSWSPIYGHN